MCKYNIEICDIEPIRVAYMKYNGYALEANKVFPNVFKSIMGKANGVPFFAYYNMDRKTGMGEMELCVPTAEVPVGNGVMIKEMPRIKAVRTTHIGPYEKLSEAYNAIDQYAEEHDIKLCMPIREIFIKGPGMVFKGNANKYVTEIIIPIKDEN